MAEKLNQLQSFVYVILFCLNNHDAANKFIYITASCVYFLIANLKMLQGTEGPLGLGTTELLASCRYLWRATSSYNSLQNVFGEYFAVAGKHPQYFTQNLLINYNKLNTVFVRSFTRFYCPTLKNKGFIGV